MEEISSFDHCRMALDYDWDYSSIPITYLK